MPVLLVKYILVQFERRQLLKAIASLKIQLNIVQGLSNHQPVNNCRSEKKSRKGNLLVCLL
ncbi:MAG: hypothetical protein EA000_07075 [Oscillatoriales cyanobacterium]|nr:MAG: hypothetical protein EA000_07075 [Oscillatoriales cyanobacterium]